MVRQIVCDVDLWMCWGLWDWLDKRDGHDRSLFLFPLPFSRFPPRGLCLEVGRAVRLALGRKLRLRRLFRREKRLRRSFALLPLTVGCSFEAIQFAGRSDSGFAKALSYPGLQLQKITTREPDAKQIECAIAALTPCIPENLEDDKW